jgi:hypothetical protein
MTKSYRLKTPKPQNAREAAYAAGNQNAREAVDRQRAEIMTAVMPASPAERICNDESKLLASFEVGDVSHQGDIIIVRIASLPRSARPRSNRQLAEGTTQGSRHVLTRGDVYDANVREVASLLKDATRVDVETRYVGRSSSRRQILPPTTSRTRNTAIRVSRPARSAPSSSSGTSTPSNVRLASRIDPSFEKGACAEPTKPAS